MEDIIIKERDFRKQLAEIFNNSKIPAIILKPIVKELLEQICLLEQQQYEEALKTKEQKTQELEVK